MSEHRVIKNVLIDFKTGATIAESDMPVERMPQEIRIEQLIQLSGTQFVIKAVWPATMPEILAKGRVEISIEPYQVVLAGDIRYTIPSISSELPGVIEGSHCDETVKVLHEDDWRQIELVSAHLEPMIDGEFKTIRTVYEKHRSDAGGFTAVHVRKMIVDPLEKTAIPLDEFRQIFSADARFAPNLGVKFAGTNLVRGGFTLTAGLGSVFYGQVFENRIAVLGKSWDTPERLNEVEIAALSTFLNKYDLLLVEWCRLTKLRPGTPAFFAYFSEKPTPPAGKP